MTAPLVVTPGDPTGIGPEVVGKALSHLGPRAGKAQRPVVVVGDVAALAPWVDGLVRVHEVRAVDHGIAVYDPGDRDEPVEVASLRIAVRACLDGRARALVTGPINKARLARRGFPHPGHTEFLGELCGVADPVMAFVGGRVRVSLVTVHVPVRRIPEVLTTERVLHTIVRSDEAMRGPLGIRRPRIAVCGLNPHAGDEGLLGTEDRDVVAPAVAAAVALGIDARGPVSAETAFRSAVRDEVDWVVAAYHDQGLAPLKALEAAVRTGAVGEDRAVNWTLGLPIVRVSVEHGTAYDIAGKGIADEGSLVAALRFADLLTQRSI